MKLWDLYRCWEHFEDIENMMVVDLKNKKEYSLYDINKEIWNRDVKAFYFDNNNLIIKV